jgi:uncharacterized membrane protein YfcA
VSEFWLFVVGLGVGLVGTLVGAGGGFLLVPLLLFVYPHDSPERITAISLAVVFFNAASGSVAYHRMGRIDYRSGLLFSLATIPGAIGGALVTSFIPRRTFDGIFGVVLVCIAAALFLRPEKADRKPTAPTAGHTHREIVDRDGTVHRYSYDLKLGMAISVGVGFLSSLLGIGGGIIHVPALVHILGFPVHLATATSHFILAITALTGTLTHLSQGSLAGTFGRILPLAIGVLIGAQAGAPLSNRIHGRNIVRVLAVALAFVGVRLLAGR